MSPTLFSLRSRLGRVAFLSLFALVLVACGADRPTPAYPASADPALEDTDLAPYVAGDEEEEEDYGPEDEEPFEAMPADGAQDADAGVPEPPTPAPPSPPTGG